MFFEDIKLNTSKKLTPVTIKKDKMIEFAKEYDNIPLHVDEEYAKTTRFGKILAPGVMTFLTVWAKYLEVDLFGNELIAGKSQKIEWFNPVFENDVLSATAEVTCLTKRNERNGVVELTISVRNQKDELVLIGATEVIVKCKPKN